MHDLLASYHDPRFWPVPVATVGVGVAGFLLFALPMTWRVFGTQVRDSEQDRKAWAGQPPV